jgi:hypothetical protein
VITTIGTDIHPACALYNTCSLDSNNNNFNPLKISTKFNSSKPQLILLNCSLATVRGLGL